MAWTLGVLAAFALTVVCFGSYAGLDEVRGLAQLTAFRTQVTVAALVVALLAVRWWRTAVVPLLLVIGLSLAGVAPRLTSELRSDAPGTTLRVLTANVLYDSADKAALAEAITARDVDVVALPEASTAYSTALAKLLDGYVVSTGSDREFRSVNTSMLVRASLRPTFLNYRPGLGNAAVSARIRAGGREVQVFAVHPGAPFPGNERRWSADLAALRPLCSRDTPTVVLGDFNATADHSGFRALLDGGCTDVGAAAGRGLVGTWPQRYPRLLGATIDHALVAGGVTPTRYAVLDVPGSDHRAVSAELAVADP